MPAIELLIKVIGLLVLPLGFWVWRLRTNDLKHLTDRLDRIEDKLDRHLEGHA